MKHRQPDSGSLDMLLDTMCNTFGGVCFIALLIAIISASLPSSSTTEEPEVEQIVMDTRINSLMKTRDELKAAIKLQEELLKQVSDEAPTEADRTLALQVLENEEKVEELKRQMAQLEEDIKHEATAEAYNKEEAERLKRVNEEKEKALANQKYERTRVVRTPQERELTDYSPASVWIYQGRIYYLWYDDEDGILETHTETDWILSIKPYKGHQLNAKYLTSTHYANWINSLTRHQFVRIFVDKDSFAEARMLIDDLIQRRKLYNWKWREGDRLYFVEGSDGQVQ